jgi:hypothetical protein
MTPFPSMHGRDGGAARPYPVSPPLPGGLGRREILISKRGADLTKHSAKSKADLT